MNKFFNFTYHHAGTTISQFHHANQRLRFIMGPLGSGKTTACAAELFFKACTIPVNKDNIRCSRFLIVRNTYNDLENTVIKSWLGLYNNDIGKFYSSPPPRHLINMPLDDGTILNMEVIFLALDRADHVRKLRGLEATAIWLNEVKELPKAILDMSDLRIGRFPSRNSLQDPNDDIWCGIIGDTNPPDEDHWYYELAENNSQLDDYLFLRQPAAVKRVKEKWQVNKDAENIHNLPKNYYQRGLSGKNDAWININLANSYGSVFDGRPVYHEFNDQIHVLNTIDFNPSRALQLGIDFGLTPACVIIQHYQNDCVNVIDEITADNMGILQFSDIIKAHLARYYPNAHVDNMFCDPAGIQRAQTDGISPIQILRCQGWNAKPAQSNNFTIRREAVSAALSHLIDGQPQLRFAKKCHKLRKGMAGGYRLARVLTMQKGEFSYSDKPEKTQESHICEALQYAMLGLGFGQKLIKKNAIQQEMAVTDFKLF